MNETFTYRILACCVLALLLPAAISCDRSAPPGSKASPSGTALEQLRSTATGERKSGIAAAIVIDTSGSMNDTVPDSSGAKRSKIEIARRCVLKVVAQADGFAKEQPDRPVLLGLYEFSAAGNNWCRTLLPMAAPNVSAAESALATLKPNGGTPIGQAIVTAKHGLDATGLNRTHILVVTDGENTDGLTPSEVMAAIAQLPEAERPAVYFIAFDVAAGVFKPVKDAGAAVLPAANEQQLQAALDALVGERILLEK